MVKKPGQLFFSDRVIADSDTHLKMAGQFVDMNWQFIDPAPDSTENTTEVTGSKAENVLEPVFPGDLRDNASSNTAAIVDDALGKETDPELGGVVYRIILVGCLGLLLVSLWGFAYSQHRRLRKDIGLDIIRKARTSRLPRGRIFIVCIASCLLEALLICAYAWRHQPEKTGIHDFVRMFVLESYSLEFAFWSVCGFVYLGVAALWFVWAYKKFDAVWCCIFLEAFEAPSLLIQATCMRIIANCALEGWFVPEEFDWRLDSHAWTPNCWSLNYGMYLVATWLSLLPFWVMVTEVRARMHTKQSKFMIDYRFLVVQTQVKILMALTAQTPVFILLPAFLALNTFSIGFNAIVGPYNIHQVNIVRTVTLSCSQVVICSSALWYWFDAAVGTVLVSIGLGIFVVIVLGAMWHHRQIGSNAMQVERAMKEYLNQQAGTKDLLEAAATGKLSSITIDPTYHTVRTLCSLIFDFQPAKKSFVVFSARESQELASTVTSLGIAGDPDIGLRLDDATAAILFNSIQHSNTTVLASLSLVNHRLSFQAVQHLSAALRDNSNLPLAKLDLRLNDIDAAGALELSSALHRNRALRELRLAGNRLAQVTPPAEELLEGADGAYSFFGFSALLHEVQGTAIETLDLGDNALTMAGGVALEAVVEGEWLALRELSLEWNSLGCVGAQGLAATLPKLPRLEHLNLRGNRIASVGCAALGAMLPALQGLIELQLEDNRVGVEGAAGLAKGLPSCPVLRRLNLRRNNLRAAGLRVLAEELRGRSGLVELNLAANALCGIDELGSQYGTSGHIFAQESVYDVSGIVSLAGYLRNPGCCCEVLDLSHNQVGFEPTAAAPAMLGGNSFNVERGLNTPARDRAPSPAGAPMIPGLGGSSAMSVLAPAVAANGSLVRLRLQVLHSRA
jgi:hypothetical protein